MRVLFVDDDAMNRKVMKTMLEAAGLQLDEADDAESGLWMIATEPYDLVLMDLRMPGMNGFAAIRRIRERFDDLAGMPIIVVTADDADDIHQQARDAGADGLLHKPVPMKTLFDAINRVMAGEALPAAKSA